MRQESWTQSTVNSSTDHIIAINRWNVLIMMYIICRYKIMLEISDSTASATCVLFEREAQTLINESANFMVASVNNGNNKLPRSIQEICGQKIIFQFRLTDYNFQSCKPDYTVSKIFLMDDNHLTANVGADEKVQSFAIEFHRFFLKLCVYNVNTKAVSYYL